MQVCQKRFLLWWGVFANWWADLFASTKPTVRPREFTLDAFLRDGVLSHAQTYFLRNAIVNRKNILVGGGAGAGKTTFLNALLHETNLLCPEDRLLLVDDLAELKCPSANYAFLRTSPWTEFKDIAESAKRFSPDRMVMGDIRSGVSALTFLGLLNTGHRGVFTSVHAIDAYGCLTRLSDFILETLPSSDLALIGDAVNVVVFLRRTKQGQRVEVIFSVDGYDPLTEKFVVKKVH